MRSLFEQIVATTACLTMAAAFTACGGGHADVSPAASANEEGAVAADPESPGAGVADVGSIALSWSAPTGNDDGSPVSDLAGYRVYYGTAQGVYTDKLTIVDPSTLSATIPNLPSNTYYVIVRAFNSMNVESAASAEMSETIL